MSNQSIATSVATKSFNFDSFTVRAINRNGDIWFVAADVCAVLDIKNTTQALAALDSDERSMFNIGRSAINGGGGEVNIINESGLYALILRSRKPEAKRFRKWVTSEVLPAIRKNGAYSLTITKAQQGELATLIAERFPSGKDRPYAWSRFNNHFRLASYKDLPASRFEEACAYIRTMPEIAPALPKPEARPQINLFAPHEFQRLRVLANQFYDDVVKRAKGEDVTPKLEIPDEVLAGIVAGQLCSTNHTIGFTHDGRMMIWKTPDPFDVVVNLIEDPGWVQPERVKKVLDACMTALTNRLGLGGTK